MARIHPNPSTTSSSSSCLSSSERERFTVWMKSLVFHGKGCTVIDSRGEVAFRVDNYQQRCSSKVFLMDSNGKVLFSINRKKPLIFGGWEGFKWIDSFNVNKERLRFQVARNHKILSRDISCRVTVRSDDQNTGSCYRIIGLERKSTLKITDLSGQLLAEAWQKQSSVGVPLGDDVLTLMVEPQADQSLIMALVTVYGLITNKL